MCVRVCVYDDHVMTPRSVEVSLSRLIVTYALFIPLPVLMDVGIEWRLVVVGVFLNTDEHVKASPGGLGTWRHSLLTARTTGASKMLPPQAVPASVLPSRLVLAGSVGPEFLPEGHSSSEGSVTLSFSQRETEPLWLHRHRSNIAAFKGRVNPEGGKHIYGVTVPFIRYLWLQCFLSVF